MEQLPVLVLGKICEFLTAKDIAACCATSRGWRDVFNQDHAWRPFCDRLLAAHLKVTECRVEPRFVSPEPEDSPLSPICEWRLSYMREVHLWNNWRQERNIQESFGSISEDKFLTQFTQFINSNQVLIKLKDEKRVMLWDVKETSVHLYDPVTLTSDEDIHLCEVIGDKIIFLQEDKIHIYKMNDSATVTWKLLGIYNRSSRVIKAFVQSDYLVVLNRNDKLEIFDLKRCKTVKITKMPRKLTDQVYILCVIEGGKGSMYFTVLLQCETHGEGESDDSEEEEHVEHSVITYVYSLEKFDFINFNISISTTEDCERDFYCGVHDEFLAVFNNGSISIYKYLTSELVLDVPNKFTYSRIKQLFPGLNVLSSTLYCRDVKRNDETNSGGFPVLLIEKMNGLSPIACQCLGYKPYNIARLLEHIREHLALPTEVVEVCLLIQYPSSVINNTYTKYIDKNNLSIVTFW